MLPPRPLRGREALAQRKSPRSAGRKHASAASPAEGNPGRVEATQTPFPPIHRQGSAASLADAVPLLLPLRRASERLCRHRARAGRRGRTRTRRGRRRADDEAGCASGRRRGARGWRPGPAFYRLTSLSRSGFHTPSQSGSGGCRRYALHLVWSMTEGLSASQPVSSFIFEFTSPNSGIASLNLCSM